MLHLVSLIVLFSFLIWVVISVFYLAWIDYHNLLMVSARIWYAFTQSIIISLSAKWLSKLWWIYRWLWKLCIKRLMKVKEDIVLISVLRILVSIIISATSSLKQRRWRSDWIEHRSFFFGFFFDDHVMPASTGLHRQRKAVSLI